MKKYTWLLIFAMLAWNAGGSPAIADAIVSETEFANSIGDKDDHSMTQGCYYNTSSCNYTDTYGKQQIVWNYSGNPDTDLHCDSFVYRCIFNTLDQGLAGGWTGIASCTSCQPGYDLTGGFGVHSSVCASPAEYWSSGGCTGGKDCTGSSLINVKSNYCVKNCTTSNCVSTAWVAKGTGYETRTYRSCSATGTSGTCGNTTQYRCAAGYYGSSSNGTSGCSLCPEWAQPLNTYTTSAKTTKVRGTSAAGATAITGCYVVPGTYYDTTGTVKVNSNCSYSN